MKLSKDHQLVALIESAYGHPHLGVLQTIDQYLEEHRFHIFKGKEENALSGIPEDAQMGWVRETWKHTGKEDVSPLFVSFQKVDAIPYQRCPICEGNGTADKQPSEMVVAGWECHVCEGKGIIPMKHI
jgi:hypothetical protein